MKWVKILRKENTVNAKTSNPRPAKKRVGARDYTVLILYALFLIALIVGIVWNRGLYEKGELEKEVFHRRMLFVAVCAVMMAAIFLLELILRVRFPLFMEITLMAFAFSALALSTVFGFYGIMSFWDTVMHTVSGVIFSMGGLCLAHLIFRNKLQGTFQTVIFLVFALLFALAVGYLWELFEFTGDSLVKNGNLQCYQNDLIEDLGNGTYIKNSLRGSGLIDTITDMFVNFAGAVVFFIVMLPLSLKKPSALNAFRPKVYPWWHTLTKAKREKNSVAQATDEEPAEEENPPEPKEE